MATSGSPSASETSTESTSTSTSTSSSISTSKPTVSTTAQIWPVVIQGWSRNEKGDIEFLWTWESAISKTTRIKGIPYDPPMNLYIPYQELIKKARKLDEIEADMEKLHRDLPDLLFICCYCERPFNTIKGIVGHLLPKRSRKDKSSYNINCMIRRLLENVPKVITKDYKEPEKNPCIRVVHGKTGLDLSYKSLPFTTRKQLMKYFHRQYIHQDEKVEKKKF